MSRTFFPFSRSGSVLGPEGAAGSLSFAFGGSCLIFSLVSLSFGVRVALALGVRILALALNVRLLALALDVRLLALALGRFHAPDVRVILALTSAASCCSCLIDGEVIGGDLVCSALGQ
jgi:hypothetical protein